MKHRGIALAFVCTFAVISVPSLRAASPDRPPDPAATGLLSWTGNYIVAAATDAKMGNLRAFSDVYGRVLEQKLTADGLKGDMRKLWTDHVVWTRDYIVAAAADAPDQKAAANRLMKNQEDIGNAVAGFYGKAAGDQLTVLLKEHITIAVDLIKAAKGGDKAGQQAADARWQKNGVDIADFLSKANPNWPRATLVDLMKTHLSTTTAEVVARLGKDWEADVRAFDEVYRHVLMMSDAISAGIVKQFPAKFAG